MTRNIFVSSCLRVNQTGAAAPLARGWQLSDRARRLIRRLRVLIVAGAGLEASKALSPNPSRSTRWRSRRIFSHKDTKTRRGSVRGEAALFIHRYARTPGWRLRASLRDAKHLRVFVSSCESNRSSSAPRSWMAALRPCAPTHTTPPRSLLLRALCANQTNPTGPPPLRSRWRKRSRQPSQPSSLSTPARVTAWYPGRVSA